jgi:hypothetical protein
MKAKRSSVDTDLVFIIRNVRVQDACRATTLAANV